MRIDHRAAIAAVALLVIGLGPASATAQQELKLNQVGAALAFPLIRTGDSGATYITVTNVSAEDRNLHFNVIGAETWEVTDFDCSVTASETLLIRWALVGSFMQLDMECNQADSNSLERVTRSFDDSSFGTLFVTNETHECKDGSCTTNSNDLFGDWVVVDPASGIGFSGEAIPFQGIDPLAPGVADRDYHFDNLEYSSFPATLTTNFIAPGVSGTFGSVTATLILFTLDGRANIGSSAALDIIFFDDDETPTSAHYEFDCFAFVPLGLINPNFENTALGSLTGHLYATTIDADQASNVHDNKFGNGNNIRVVGVHGWLLQRAGNAFWTRTLSQGMLPQDLDGTDVPTFDGL